MANNKNNKKKTATKKVAKVEKVEKEKIEVEEVVTEKVEKKKETTKTDKGDKRFGIILTIGLVVFIILSFFLPEVTPKPASEDSVLAWTDDIASGMVVTVLGSSTCPHCQELKPVIKNLAETEPFQLYFFELDKLQSSEQTILTETVPLENFQGSVPFIFVTYNGELLGDTVGYGDEETLKEFLREYEVIK